MKAAVLGATGYTGGILLRLLSTHPEVREIIAVSSSQAGQRVRAVDPGLSPAIEQKMGRRGGTLVSLEEAVKAASAGELDVVFSGPSAPEIRGSLRPPVGEDRGDRSFSGLPAQGPRRLCKSLRSRNAPA